MSERTPTPPPRPLPPPLGGPVYAIDRIGCSVALAIVFLSVAVAVAHRVLVWGGLIRE